MQEIIGEGKVSLMHRFISVYQKHGDFLIVVNWWVYLRAEPGDPLRTSHTFYSPESLGCSVTLVCPLIILGPHSLTENEVDDTCLSDFPKQL